MLKIKFVKNIFMKKNKIIFLFIKWIIIKLYNVPQSKRTYKSILLSSISKNINFYIKVNSHLSFLFLYIYY